MFNLERVDDIAIVTMDDPDQSQNVINKTMQTEFASVINNLEHDKDLRAVIFTSAKDGCFVAGADIKMLQQVESAGQASQLCHELHNTLQRIADLPITTVAAINGACLGGGLELSLVFDYRIASTAKSTKIGVPEVQLGLLPGGGGTQRIPRLISLPTALDMMLTGRQLNAKRALKAGLVDDAVAPEVLLEVAKKYAVKGKPTRKVPFKDKLMRWGAVRSFVISQAHKKMMAQTKGKYPAPKLILETVDQGLGTSLKQGLAIEAESFGKLVMTPESKQLINLFFAITDSKKDSGIDGDEQAREVNNVGVLGAGLMGAGISYVTVNQAKKTVRLKDISVEGLAKGVEYVGKILDKRVSRRRMTSSARDQALTRLTTSLDYRGFEKSDVVIEAVFESLDLKQTMIADIEALKTDKETIFATNTSAIPIDDVAAKAIHPERVIGMHYFSPVEKMPLLEVIRGSKTADWVTATAVELGKKQGKTVIVVNDGPGFYTTRILVPYNMEAVRLILEGVSIEDIDNAMEQFGFPVGPIKLMDEVGIDVGKHIVENLNQAFGDRIPLIEGMDSVMADERKGRKNGKGFYDYSDKSKGKQVDESVYRLMGVTSPGSNTMPSAEIAERIVLTMLNEAAYCMEQGILRSVRDGDVGAIFGLGFPPFLGGPFRYMDNMGIETVVEKLQALQEQHGERFTPAPILMKMAKDQTQFYSENDS